MDIKAIKGNLTVRNDTINNYLKDINKFPVLTPQQELDLIYKIKNGDEEARTMLINCNQRFVFAIAKRYASNEKVSDLVDEANIGLIKAINEYDATIGVRFLSYAVWYIRRAIHYYLINDNLLVKKSNNMKIGSKTNTIENKFFCENGRYPSDDEIIEILKNEYDIDVCNVADVQTLDVQSISSSVTDDDKDNTLEDSYEFSNKTASYNDYESKMQQDYNHEVVQALLSCLKEKDAQVIKMAFGIGYDKEYNNYEIAEELGFSSERIRQIKNKALAKLQTAVKQIGY